MVPMRQHNGNVHYVYADQQRCNCPYVGKEPAYQQYSRQMQRDRRASHNELAAHQ